MFSIESKKIKITLIGLCGLGTFVLGRASVPKPQPQIKIVDNTKSIEIAIENTKKQMSEALQKQVVLETHTVRSKSGNSKTDVKEYITYKKNLSENTNKNITSKVETSENKTIEVKSKYQGIDYTFMIGRSFSDAHYDYIAFVGIPIFNKLKANAGFEFNDKKVFLGATFSF